MLWDFPADMQACGTHHMPWPIPLSMIHPGHACTRMVKATICFGHRYLSSMMQAFNGICSDRTQAGGSLNARKG